MKKKNRFELRRDLKKQRQQFLTAIHLKCYDCMGFFADGYSDCEITSCPLYPFRVKQGNLKAKKIQALGSKLRKLCEDRQYPSSDYWLKVYEKQ